MLRTRIGILYPNGRPVSRGQKLAFRILRVAAVALLLLAVWACEDEKRQQSLWEDKVEKIIPSPTRTLPMPQIPGPGPRVPEKDLVQI